MPPLFAPLPLKIRDDLDGALLLAPAVSQEFAGLIVVTVNLKHAGTNTRNDYATAMEERWLCPIPTGIQSCDGRSSKTQSSSVLRASSAILELDSDGPSLGPPANTNSTQ
jgi:hypothetical protein